MDDAGFDRLGWSPEGYVFFNYAIGCDSAFSEWTGTASADIDADGTPQVWGYTKGRPPAKTHVCDDLATMTPETVGPCKSTYGQSVF